MNAMGKSLPIVVTGTIFGDKNGFLFSISSYYTIIRVMSCVRVLIGVVILVLEGIRADLFDMRSSLGVNSHSVVLG